MGATKYRVGLVNLINFLGIQWGNFQRTNELCPRIVHHAYYFLEIVTHKWSYFDVKNAINCQIVLLYLDFVVRITLILDLKYFFSYKYNIYQHKLITKVSNVFNYGQFFPISKTSKKFCVRNLKVSEIFRHLIVLLRYF